jgi:hypothetical protein
MQNAPLKYRSGDEIKKGDRVLFHGNEAKIELVARDPDDPEESWYVSEYGGGVMVSDPLVSGRTFIQAGSLAEYEDLVYVSRAAARDTGPSSFTIEFHQHVPLERRKYCLTRLGETGAIVELHSEQSASILCLKPNQLAHVGWLLFHSHFNRLCSIVATSGEAQAKASAYPSPTSS